MPLRDYQQDAVYQLRQAVARSGSAVYCLATGAGKTVVAAEIARLAGLKGSRTLFLVHRRELVRQAVDTLYEACPGEQVGVIAAGWPELPWAPLQVGMVQSIAKRERIPDFDLIIVDEAHHARAKTWATVLARWPKARLIGLTATPQRLDGKGLGEHFAEMVLGPTIPELVAMGSLAPCLTLRVPSGLVLDDLKKNRAGEYNAKDITGRVTGPVVANAVEAYVRYAKGKRAIFFGIHRDHSKRVIQGLRDAGFRAEHVDGDDPAARRDRVMNGLKTGGLDVVGNCDLISEGFDAPGCEAVIIGAPTSSVTRYLQQAGRAMRPGEGKTALILDLAGISHDLGLPDDVREWDLADGEIRQPTKAHQTPRECPNCPAVFWGRTCPQCHHTEPLMEVEQVEVELEVARAPDKPLKQGNRRSDLWREVGQAKRSANPERALLALAERKGYKPGWAAHILRAWRIAA